MKLRGHCAMLPSIMKQLPIITSFLAYANRLKFKNLFLLTVALFIADLLIPDMIPMIDEIILGLLAILFSQWKKDRTEEPKGETIEGEVVEDEDKK